METKQNKTKRESDKKSDCLDRVVVTLLLMPVSELIVNATHGHRKARYPLLCIFLRRLPASMASEYPARETTYMMS